MKDATPGIARIKELVVISGKGGTGKTSVAAALAALSGRVVTADCDVDAANMHLLMAPEIRKIEAFSGGEEAVINEELCMACGECMKLCRFGAIREEGGRFTVDHVSCEGCSVCSVFCPAEAIEMRGAKNGEWYISDTRYGPMVHARLFPGADNSGKLVTVVRENAKKVAESEGLSTVIIDGSPGTGCPVIASVTGADAILAVTEPSMSAMHDLERVLGLAKHFAVPVSVAVNRCDINEEITDMIIALAEEKGARLAGTIRFDGDFTRAQIEGKNIIEYPGSSAAEDVRKVWKSVMNELNPEEI